MNLQTSIAFPVHVTENNNESQRTLDARRENFGGQCRKIFEHLSAGYSLNGDQARELFGVRHLPRRIKDLKTLGIDISGTFGEDGLKIYFINS